MAIGIFIAMIGFMALFIPGVVMLAAGLMRKRRRQWIWGIALLLLCIVFTWCMKFVPGVG